MLESRPWDTGQLVFIACAFTEHSPYSSHLKRHRQTDGTPSSLGMVPHPAGPEFLCGRVCLMPNTQTHRTVLLFINTPMSAHTHTHTHTLPWLLYVVNFHLVHKNSPELLSLGHTHAHFRCPPPRTRRHHSHTLHSWERAGCMALILRTQAQQCCLLPCVQPHQKAGPGNGARSERSLSRGASPSLYPLPFLSGAQSLQACALSSHPRARPCPPRQTPAGSGAVLSPPSGSGPHVDPRLVQGGRPCTPPPLEAAQVWPASLSPHPRSAPVAVAVRRGGRRRLQTQSAATGTALFMGAF